MNKKILMLSLGLLSLTGCDFTGSFDTNLSSLASEMLSSSTSSVVSSSSESSSIKSSLHESSSTSSEESISLSFNEIETTMLKSIFILRGSKQTDGTYEIEDQADKYTTYTFGYNPDTYNVTLICTKFYAPTTGNLYEIALGLVDFYWGYFTDSAFIGSYNLYDSKYEIYKKRYYFEYEGVKYNSITQSVDGYNDATYSKEIGTDNATEDQADMVFGSCKLAIERFKTNIINEFELNLF